MRTHTTHVYTNVSMHIHTSTRTHTHAHTHTHARTHTHTHTHSDTPYLTTIRTAQTIQRTRLLGIWASLDMFLYTGQREHTGVSAYCCPFWQPTYLEICQLPLPWTPREMVDAFHFEVRHFPPHKSVRKILRTESGANETLETKRTPTNNAYRGSIFTGQHFGTDWTFRWAAIRRALKVFLCARLAHPVPATWLYGIS